MYFDFEDYRPDIEPIGHVISWRDEIFVSVGIHVLAIALLLYAPRLFPAPTVPKQTPFVLNMQERPRFVFVQPRIDIESPKPPPRAEESDKNRIARSVEQAPKPTNRMPFSRGNTPDRVEAQRREVARGQGPAPQPAAGQQMTQQAPQPPAQTQSAANTVIPRLSESPSALPVPAQPKSAQNGVSGLSGLPGGNLGAALKNLQRYVQSQNYDNEGGSSPFGSAIQFDTKGVEFGPWIRRFIAQIKRNWFIPYAAMSMKGHVVITFNVHKDGSITDLTVVGPCPVDAFNNAAFGALASSNPTQPLPPEYPSEKAFFTVTFYYNEQPQ